MNLVSKALAVIIVMLLIVCLSLAIDSGNKTDLIDEQASEIVSLESSATILETNNEILTDSVSTRDIALEALASDVIDLNAKVESLEAQLEQKVIEEDEQAVITSGGWVSAEASWYGPGFYGNTMAGGGTYTTETWGVAHKTLAFGTLVDIEYAGKVALSVPVTDHGPFVSGREFDLSAAVADYLGFTGVQDIKWRRSEGG